MSKQSIFMLVAVALVAIGAFLTGQSYERMSHENQPDHSHSEGSDEHSMGKDEGHSHDMSMTYEWPADLPTPTIDVRVEKDPMKGYNLFVDTTNFRFAPENASRERVPGEGHAHLIIDGKKVTRLYGNAYYLGADYEKGDREVIVELSANDHSAIVKNGEPIKASTFFIVE